jgi:hypothetical protein
MYSEFIHTSKNFEGGLPKQILEKNTVFCKKGVEIWAFDGIKIVFLTWVIYLKYLELYFPLKPRRGKIFKMLEIMITIRKSRGFPNGAHFVIHGKCYICLTYRNEKCLTELLIDLEKEKVIFSKGAHYFCGNM